MVNDMVRPPHLELVFDLIRIGDQIDWEESEIAGRICVRPHLDDELDYRKHVYHGIDDILVSSSTNFNSGCLISRYSRQ